MEVIKTPIKIPIEFKELFNPQYRYFAIYGGRGSLKSHTVARRLILAARENKVRILCTRELQKSITDSVHKLLSDIIALYEFDDFEITKQNIINKQTGSEFIFTGIRNNTNEIKSMEGIDYCWCEEAQALTKDSIEVLTPTIRKPGSQLIFTYNRLNELDAIHRKLVIDEQPDTCVINVNYDVALKYGWMPEVLRKEMEADKEVSPALYAHKWLGEPLSQAEMSIIPRDSILKAMSQEIDDDGAVEVGVDVARMGSDRTVFVMRKGFKTVKFDVHNQLKTVQVCDKLEQFVGFNKDVVIKVDDTGVGGGVTDDMERRGYQVVAINFGGSANDTDKYPNWISEAWFYLAEIIENIQLPMNQDLLMELSSRQWGQDSRGKRRVEGKDQYKKRGFRSPDLADAFIICFATPSNFITNDDIAL